jgi:hypothetical protein
MAQILNLVTEVGLARAAPRNQAQTCRHQRNTGDLKATCNATILS